MSENTREPSGPSHQNELSPEGQRFVSFQRISCVTKNSNPLLRRICGIDHGKPNELASHATRAGLPKSLVNVRCPYSACRTSDSPEGRFASDSTHHPPTGSQRCSFTSNWIRASSAGSCSSIHS